MLLLLLALGSWQVQRLGWKDAILARIAAAEAAPPVPLPAQPSPFQKVSVTGHFLPAPSALYGVETRDVRGLPTMGGQLLAPFATGGRVVLVDRGWMPTTKQMGAPDVASPAGTITLSGYAHPADHPNWISASDDPAARMFFTLNPEHIASSLGIGRVAPFALIALGPPPTDGGPVPAEHLPRPPNNHLVYALTWFALAGGLIVVFTSWARKRLSHDPL